MPVIIDENAGFCFGVVKAIASAEQHLEQSNSLYCLGDIVHNNEEVSRLSRLGLRVIDHNQLPQLPNSTVLIRAHGEPPETYALARQHNITLVDATCPIVLALQKKIRDGYEAMRNVGGQVVIFGKPGHAEVVGLNGQTGNSAIIVSSPDDLSMIDFQRPIRLFSQTTQNQEEYNLLISNIKQRVGHHDSDDWFVAYNTICSRMVNRASQLKDFAAHVQQLIFVSGVNSSNGHYLYDYCRRVQPNTLLISSPDELTDEQVNPWRGMTVGITGATSTPRWLMEQVKNRIEASFELS
ncbi:MAG: 4-hydroxy-3-methylbut-2-enyl diphosphate reductase [Bacteroidales bacterium]|nr:4-hydroxy-3-methylbut-2-enyl diphosphate reductase [Bacteroidales bacterium]